MKQYIITEAMNFNAGSVLELSEKQYKGRDHCLKKIGNNKYEVLKTVQFKIGEVIGLDGEIDKGLQHKLNACEVKKEVKKPYDIKN